MLEFFPKNEVPKIEEQKSSKIQPKNVENHTKQKLPMQ